MVSFFLNYEKKEVIIYKLFFNNPHHNIITTSRIKFTSFTRYNILQLEENRQDYRLMHRPFIFHPIPKYHSSMYHKFISIDNIHIYVRPNIPLDTVRFLFCWIFFSTIFNFDSLNYFRRTLAIGRYPPLVSKILLNNSCSCSVECSKPVEDSFIIFIL